MELSLEEYLKDRINRWRDILNSAYKNDSGKSQEDYAKGKMSAYIDALDYLRGKDEKLFRIRRERR